MVALTYFDQGSNPERPERLINTEAYLLEKHRESIEMAPTGHDRRGPGVRTGQNIWTGGVNRLILMLTTPFYPGIEVHARRAAGSGDPLS